MGTITHDMPTTYIKHKGFLDVSKLIQSIRGWFIDKKYDFHFSKQKYAGPVGAAEQELEMYGEREMTEYVKFKIKLLIRIWDIKDVEVVKDGEKIKTTTGRVAIELGGNLLLDYRARFKGNKALQFLQAFYHKYIIKATLEEVWEEEWFMHVGDLGKLIRKQFQHEIIS
jgi:hypothetical protein